MRWRHVLVCLGLLSLLAGPTVALAQGGGSAGDQQYTDPFGSTTHSSATHTQTQQTTTSAPATTPPATSTTPATTPAAATTTAVASSPPVATAATGSGKTLPYTGLDLWTVVGIGLTLVTAGLLIRVRSRRA